MRFSDQIPEFTSLVIKIMIHRNQGRTFLSAMVSQIFPKCWHAKTEIREDQEIISEVRTQNILNEGCSSQDSVLKIFLKKIQAYPKLVFFFSVFWK